MTAIQKIEVIADAAFYVFQNTPVSYDQACKLVREAADDADADGIAYTAEMLAEVVLEVYA